MPVIARVRREKKGEDWGERRRGCRMRRDGVTEAVDGALSRCKAQQLASSGSL